MQGKAPNDLGYLWTSLDNFNAALGHFLAKRFYCTQAIRGDKVRYDLLEVCCTYEQCQVTYLQRLTLGSYLNSNLAKKFTGHYSRSD
ncbi:MAG: chorismate mutase [Bartonella sp.]|nr:chorismate mutase [Bartonella sp.]